MKGRYITDRERRLLRTTVTAGTGLVLDTLDATGLRVGDVVALETARLDEARRRGGWLTVVEQKTGKPRKLRLPSHLAEALRAHAGEQWVFTSPRDPTQHRGVRGVEHALRRGCDKLGIDPDGVSPHGYRKSYAVRRLKETGDLETVRRELNHDDAALTAYYATSDKQHRGVKRKDSPRLIGIRGAEGALLRGGDTPPPRG